MIRGVGTEETNGGTYLKSSERHLESRTDVNRTKERPEGNVKECMFNGKGSRHNDGGGQGYERERASLEFRRSNQVIDLTHEGTAANHNCNSEGTDSRCLNTSELCKALHIFPVRTIGSHTDISSAEIGYTTVGRSRCLSRGYVGGSQGRIEIPEAFKNPRSTSSAVDAGKNSMKPSSENTDDSPSSKRCRK